MDGAPKCVALPALLATAQRNRSADLPPPKPGHRQDSKMPRLPSPPVCVMITGYAHSAEESTSSPLSSPLPPNRPRSRPFSSRKPPPKLSRSWGFDDLFSGDAAAETPSVLPSPSYPEFLADSQSPHSTGISRAKVVVKNPSRPRRMLHSLLPWSPLISDDCGGSQDSALPARLRPKPPVIARFGPCFPRPASHTLQDDPSFSNLNVSPDLPPVIRVPRPPHGYPTNQYVLPSFIRGGFLPHRKPPLQDAP